MKTVFAVASFVTMLLPAVAMADGSAQKKTDLNAPYQLSVGELMALSANEIVGVTKMTVYDSAVLYSKDKGRLVFVIFGSSRSVDSAKDVIDQYKTKQIVVVAAWLESMYGKHLPDDGYSISYFNKLTGRSVLDWSEGKFTIPDDPKPAHGE